MTTVLQVPASLVGAHVIVHKWHKQLDEAVKRGELLVELMVETELLPLVAPVAGVIDKLNVRVNDQVVANDVLAVIKEGLPGLLTDNELLIDPQYQISDLDAHTQLALKQLLAEQASKYALEVQSLPPQWQSSDTAGSAMAQGAGLREHPAFKNKSYGARQEEKRHPSDMDRDQVAAAQLNYNPELRAQPQPSTAPTPNPHR